MTPRRPATKRSVIRPAYKSMFRAAGAEIKSLRHTIHTLESEITRLKQGDAGADAANLAMVKAAMRLIGEGLDILRGQWS